MQQICHVFKIPFDQIVTLFWTITYLFFKAIKFYLAIGRCNSLGKMKIKLLCNHNANQSIFRGS